MLPCSVSRWEMPAYLIYYRWGSVVSSQYSSLLCMSSCLLLYILHIGRCLGCADTGDSWHWELKEKIIQKTGLMWGHHRNLRTLCTFCITSCPNYLEKVQMCWIWSETKGKPAYICHLKIPCRVFFSTNTFIFPSQYFSPKNSVCVLEAFLSFSLHKLIFPNLHPCLLLLAVFFCFCFLEHKTKKHHINFSYLFPFFPFTLIAWAHA